jgi:hypothetical protein
LLPTKGSWSPLTIHDGGVNNEDTPSDRVGGSSMGRLGHDVDDDGLRPERIAKQSTREHLDDENSSLFMVIVVMSLVDIFVQVEVLGRRLPRVKATKTYVMVR